MRRFSTLIAGVGFLLSAFAAQADDPSLNHDANAAFLAHNATQPGVIVRPSGLQYKIIQNGYGKRAAPRDSVNVTYTGKLINGKVFDASEPGLPANFKLADLIPGWTEALSLMREGDHWQIVIPADLGYGGRGAGNGTIPPDQTLIFDMQLISVVPAPPDQDQDQNGQGGGGR